MNAHELLRKSITTDLISHDLDCISPQNPLRLLAVSECNWTDLLLNAARQPDEARKIIAQFGFEALSAIRKYNETRNAIRSKYKRLIWIEHYPPGTFFHRNNNTHLIVKWSGNTQDTPHWRQLDNTAAVEHTGLPLSELTPDHDFLLSVRA